MIRAPQPWPMDQDIAHYILRAQNVGDRPARPGIGNPLTRREKDVERKQQIMSTNTETVRKIQTEFANLQHEKKTLEGNHEMSFRDAVRALYPTLQRMRRRGFKTKEIAQQLNEYGINIKPATLSKYMNEAEQGKNIKRNSGKKPSSTCYVKKPASQPAGSANAHAPATPSESE